MTLEFEVRPLGPDDVGRMVDLRAEMLADTPVAFLGTPEDDQGLVPGVVLRRLSHGENITMGAFGPGGDLLSVAGVFREPRLKLAHKANIVSVYTTPSARRQGVSRAVLERLIEHARSMEGIEVLQLSVSAEAPGAQRLYEGLGFRVWGTEPRALANEGRQVDEVHMWRPA